MQKYTHTTFLLIIKNKNELEVSLVCARGENFYSNLKNKNQDDSVKFEITQGSFFDSESSNPVSHTYLNYLVCLLT